MKNKTLATLLAALLGGLGVHRFYLGQRRAWWYLGLCWTLVPVVIGWIDALSFYSMTYATFNRRYSLKNDFQKKFPNEDELYAAVTESEREDQLIAALEQMTSKEKITEFLEEAKQQGDYLPRVVYLRAHEILNQQQ
ncbi:MAG: NINE protein [Tunicatimonas sp.]